MGRSGAIERNWVLRPGANRPANVQALSGSGIHAVGPVGRDGCVEVVLRDGTRVRVTRGEIVAE